MKAPSNSRRSSKERGVRFNRWRKWIHWAASGALLFGLGGCLGPNPGFFLSTSVANASISALVNSLLTDVLRLGGG